MKTYINLLIAIIAAVTVISCTKEPDTGTYSSEEGALLNMSVNFQPFSKLAELPNGNAMADSVIGGKNYELNNVGLYIYYTDDYNNNDLTQPYIRNMECTVEDGKLYHVLAPGENATNRNIFIYDRMTIVAFYPYNAEVDDFTTREDEENYPITRNDYSEQYYIPYRAQVETNPTIAFYTELWFYPKHTYKVEIVVVSDGEGPVPDLGVVKLLPNIDPVDNEDTDTDGKREKWYDDFVSMQNEGGGSHVLQYTAYVWTIDNDLKKGEVLLESDGLILISSQDLKVTEEYVYRYGYNMTTGEIFIPTSTNLIHDLNTLEMIDGSSGNFYQVCDIDVSGAGSWKPMKLYGNTSGSRFDGGVHKITGLTMTTSESTAGLFGLIQGNSIVCNVNLIEPEITVNATDTCYVGAICGKVNNILSEEDRLALIGTFPDNLSDVVKNELIKALLEDALNSQSKIVACRVENPTITVTRVAPRVGSISGSAEDRNEEGTYKSGIWDTYSLGGTISVNAGNPAANDGAYVGGFCGLNNGFITRSYTTIDDITAEVEIITGTDPNGDPVYGTEDIYQGFATMGTLYTSSEGGYITNDWAELDDDNSNVSSFQDSWPTFGTYTGIWPVLSTGWMSSPGTSFWYDLGSETTYYPILQWERR